MNMSVWPGSGFAPDARELRRDVVARQPFAGRSRVASLEAIRREELDRRARPRGDGCLLRADGARTAASATTQDAFHRLRTLSESSRPQRLDASVASIALPVSLAGRCAQRLERLLMIPLRQEDLPFAAAGAARRPRELACRPATARAARRSHRST